MSRVDVQQDLFRQIVTLDEPRILSRLRSNHARKTQKTRGKPELLPLLNKAVHDESIFGRNKTATALVTSIRFNSKRLSQRFSDFEEARGNDSQVSVSQDILVEILIQIDKFDVDGLETVLAKSSMIDPSLKAYLPQAMRKIGRYYRIACDLVNAARSPGNTIFRRISVQPIQRPHFDMAFMADRSAGFDQVAQRVTRSSQQDLLNSYGSQALSAARTRFKSRMSNCPVPWKVHAEIQLLLFYKQQSNVSRPRIIGSSKSACYLCDLFVRTHGEFCVPRTHGRLYDRWILPEHAINGHLLSVIDRFNAALEAKIRHTLRSRARSLPHPNESVLVLGQPWSSSSTLAEPHEQASLQGIVNSIPETASKDLPKPPYDGPPRSPSSPIISTSRDQPVAYVHDDANPQPDLRPTEPTEVTRYLSFGDSLTHNLLTPQDTLTIETGLMRLHTSWDRSTLDRISERSSPPRAYWIHVQYCSASESRLAGDEGSIESVDVESLAENRDTVVEGGAALSEKRLALRVRGGVIVVKFMLEDVASGHCTGT